MNQTETRLDALNVMWDDVASTQADTVQDIGRLVRAEFVERGATEGGLEWHYTWPPVKHLEFEMDVRGVARDLLM